MDNLDQETQLQSEETPQEAVPTDDGAALSLSDLAVEKVKETMHKEGMAEGGLRVSVVGGGCSGFQYSMAFENNQLPLDKVFNYDGLQVYVDQASLLYLDNCKVDYVETMEGAGFKFDNPNVTSTCGCGSSFNA